MPEDFETAGGSGDGGELKESAIFLRLWPEALFSKKHPGVNVVGCRRVGACVRRIE